MSGNFEETIKSYVNAIVEVHHKYKTKKYHDKALDITHDMLTIIFDVFAQLNPNEMEALNAMELAKINDTVCAQYAKKKRTVKKAVKTVNVYTNIFTPIVRNIVEDILKEWDEKEPDIRYNRPTSINSIASKIYKNMTNKANYTDTYEYQPNMVDGKNKGTIVASASNPDDADAIIDKYADVINQIMEDKKDIEASLEEIPEEEIKNAKTELIKQYLDDHATVYDSIRDYVIEFTYNYKDALRDMCVDKPLKAKKTKAPTDELIIEEEKPVTKKTPKKVVEKKNIAPPTITNTINTTDINKLPFSIPKLEEVGTRVDEVDNEPKENKKGVTKSGVKRNIKKSDKKSGKK